MVLRTVDDCVHCGVIRFAVCLRRPDLLWYRTMVLSMIVYGFAHSTFKDLCLVFVENISSARASTGDTR